MTGNDAASGNDSASLPGPIHRLFAGYVDRLNAGETLDPEEIRREHPEYAEELIEQLEEFKAFGSSHSEVVDTFGQYRILGELGRGGMGVVYDAHDAPMDRRVALKILSAGLAVDQRSVERFRREARIVGRLKHPGIVAVYATGVEAGTPYIAMEFVEGESLEKILARKRPAPGGVAKSWRGKVFASRAHPVSADAATVEVRSTSRDEGAEGETTDDESWSPIPSTTADMDLGYCITMAKTFAAVTEGLEHAHANGIIHRDLKPSNLILDPDGHLRILDFGLARLEGQDHLTGSGEVVGTPRYMSPEQAHAARHPIDHRTDIYSLGATLYEVLTLAPAFQGRTVEETLSQIVSREPRSPRQVNPRIPRDLETIVLKCMRKKPTDRYESAQALADDLRAFSRGDPIKARPQSLIEKSVRWVRQHRAGIAIAAIMMVAAVFAVWSTLERRARQRLAYEDLVNAAAIKLERSAALAERAGVFAWEGASYNPYLLSAGMDGEYDGDEHVVEAIGILERAIDAVPNRPAAYYHLSRALAIRTEYEEAHAALDHAIDLGFVPAMVLKSSLLEYETKTDEASEMVERAKAEARRKGSAEWIESWLSAHQAARRGEWSEAARAYEQLLRVEERTGKPIYLGSSVEFYMNSGVAYLEAKDYERARDCFAAVKALRPGAVEPELFMGILHRARGDARKAEEVFEALYERERSEDVLFMVTTLYWARFHDFRAGLRWAERLEEGFVREFWRASFLNGLGRSEEAVDIASRLPELRPEAPLAYFVAALAYNGAGDYANGEVMARKAALLAPRSSVPLTALAQALAMQEQYTTAIGALMRAVQLEPNVPAPKYFLGMAWLQAGRADEGIRLIEEALELAGKTRFGILVPEQAHFELGRAYASRQDLSKAREHLERAVELGRENRTLDPVWSRELARVEWEAGERIVALQTLDEAFWQPLASPSRLQELEDRYGEYAAMLLPDLPTFRSVDLFVASKRRDEVLGAETTWKFFRGVKPPGPGSSWTRDDYDDSGWEGGAGSIGYGYQDLGTVLEDMRNLYSTVYLRRQFSLPRLETYRRILLKVKADDGFIAYLNGKEIKRVGVGDEAVLPHDAFATERVDKQLSSVEVALAPSEFAKNGRNVLAVQGVNFNLESSDLALFVSLVGERIPHREEHRRLVERFQSVVSGEGARERVAYLRGRLLQEEEAHADAVAQLTLAVGNGDTSFLPRVALARSLRELKRPEEAAKVLHEILVATCPGRQELWNEWLALSLSDSGRPPEEVSSSFPCRADKVPRGRTYIQPRHYVEDVEWLVERLERREPIRINCGGGEYRGPDGRLWSFDRFHRSGRTDEVRAGTAEDDIDATENDRLYKTHRSFPSGASDTPSLGYAVPVPSGPYRLVLHFAETRFTEPGHRLFDVVAEHTALLEGFELEKYAAAEIESFDIDVKDGLLELDFRPRRGNPMISAIEIHDLD